MPAILTDRKEIANNAQQKDYENHAFRSFLKNIDAEELDKLVHKLNTQIAPEIDCTTCGACCRQLMINVTLTEVTDVSTHLGITPHFFENKFIEKSLQGNMIMNTIPCHFLADSKCSIYEKRFTECRAFPHLHEPNFKGRLFGTLIHYAMCPIIYNVVEALKVETNFITD